MSIIHNKVSPAWPYPIATNAAAFAAGDRGVKFLNFDHDPLAMICAIQRSGEKDLSLIHSLIESTGAGQNVIDSNIEITQVDQELADKIRTHFVSSVLMRRLKNALITSFMNDTEEVLDRSTPTNNTQIKILVKLPEFYERHLQTEEILKDRKCAPGEINSSLEVNEVLTFVGKVRRTSKRENEYRYYCATQDNVLFSFFIKHTEQSWPVWDYLMKKGKFRVSGTAVVGFQPGYARNFYKLGYNYEISDVDN
jgi:hypothetical protein